MVRSSLLSFMIFLGAVLVGISLAVPASEARSARGCMCILNYQPVCGSDGRLYGNSCQAMCAGVRIVSAAPCMKKSKSTFPYYRLPYRPPYPRMY